MIQPPPEFASAFDTVADSYDTEFEENLVTKNIRGVVWKTLLGRFNAGEHVLELNCGTGTDAVMLAERGIRVTAVDASENMLAQARRKAELKGVAPIIKFQKMSFNELHRLEGQIFDGCFSNFGGLNCSPDMGEVIRKTSTLLKKNASFLACLMNKVSVWEIGGFLARGKFSKAVRRFARDGADTRLGAAHVHAWYYTSCQVTKILSPWFNVMKVYGLSIFSPPPNSRAFIAKHERLSYRLLDFDNSVRNVFPFFMLGDHFVVLAQRR